MSLSEILEAVSKLTPAEKAQVAKQLDEKSESDETRSLVERQEELNRELLAEGIIKSLPARRGKIRRFTPIKVEGKPLSETIIEERR
jgi:hypothetical protein